MAKHHQKQPKSLSDKQWCIKLSILEDNQKRKNKMRKASALKKAMSITTLFLIDCELFSVNLRPQLSDGCR